MTQIRKDKILNDINKKKYYNNYAKDKVNKLKMF